MGLAKDRHLFKALETFCFIKAYCLKSNFNASPANVATIATESRRSTKTIKRRIELLVAQGWLRPIGNSMYEHAAWDTLRIRYNIRHTHFYHLKPCKTVQLEYLIKAKVFSEKKTHCEFGYRVHLRRKPFDAEIIKQVSGTLRGEVVAKHQLENFLWEGKSYDAEASSALSLRYVHRNENHINADFEINYKTGTKIYGYQSYGGFAVLKRRLIALGVIERESRRTVIAQGHNTTLKKRKTRLGFVKYERDLRQVHLIQPDKITVVPNVHVDARNEAIKQFRNEIKKRLDEAA
jgi:hypothetical protein